MFQMRIKNNYGRCLQITVRTQMWCVTIKNAQLLVGSDMENAMKMCELFKG